MEIGHFVWLRSHSARYNLSSSSMIPFDPREVEQMDWSGRSPVEVIREAYGAGDSGVMLVHGTQEGNFLAAVALRGKVDAAVVVSPEYEPIRALPAFLGLRFSAVNDVFQVPRRSLLLFSNPNNPTGFSLGEKELEELEVELERRESFAVVDSIFVDFVNRSPRLWFGNMVFTASTSKFYTMAGMKVGWAIGDPRLLRDMGGVADLVSPGPMDVEAKYAAALVEGREYVRSRNAEIVRANGNIMMKYMDDVRGLVDVKYVGDMPIAFVEPKCDLTGMAAAEELLRREVMVVPAEFFGLRRGFRVGLGSIDVNAAEAGLRLIRDFIRECSSRLP